jgi:protein-tyrosine phosphatase
MEDIDFKKYEVVEDKNILIYKILDCLYLGCEKVSTNSETLENNKIKRIIKIGYELEEAFVGKYEYLSINIHDHFNEDIYDYFDKCYYFIENSIEKKENILIHCAAGISRSVSIICAYLIKKKKWNFNRAINFIRETKPLVNPNCGFEQQLHEYSLRNNSKIFKKNNYRKKTKYHIKIKKPYVSRTEKTFTYIGKNMRKDKYILNEKIPPRPNQINKDEKLIYLYRLLMENNFSRTELPIDKQRASMMKIIKNSNELVEKAFKTKKRISKKDSKRRKDALSKFLKRNGLKMIEEILSANFKDEKDLSK